MGGLIEVVAVVAAVTGALAWLRSRRAARHHQGRAKLNRLHGKFVERPLSLPTRRR